MPILADNWDEGKYIQEGEHVVKVVGVRMFTFNSGGPGVEFKLINADKQEINVGLSLKEKALWKLSTLAKACGFSREECHDYDTSNLAHHQRLIGKKFSIRVIKPGKYSEVEAWWALDPVAASTPEPAETPEEIPPVVLEPEIKSEANDDDLPF